MTDKKLLREIRSEIVEWLCASDCQYVSAADIELFLEGQDTVAIGGILDFGALARSIESLMKKKEAA